MPRRKFDTTQRGISDTHTDAPIATSICENKLVYAERIRTLRAAANLSQGELAEWDVRERRRTLSGKRTAFQGSARFLPYREILM